MRTRTKQVLVFAAIVGVIVTFITLLVFEPMILGALFLMALTIFLLWMIWITAVEIVEHFGGGGGDA